MVTVSTVVTCSSCTAATMIAELNTTAAARPARALPTCRHHGGDDGGGGDRGGTAVMTGLPCRCGCRGCGGPGLAALQDPESADPAGRSGRLAGPWPCRS